MTHPLVVNIRNTKKFDVYVGRPSQWGNPFRVETHARGMAIDLYKIWLEDHPELVEAAKEELRGKILGCWCAPQPCHADVLAELANS